MAELAALSSRRASNAFLGTPEAILWRLDADEIDAAYGETFDPIALSTLIALTQRSRAA